MFRKRIYLDYASLTPIDPRVMREMRKFSAPKYANPSSWYREGVDAKKVKEASRKTVADILHAHPNEIIFTSGGTEANGLAVEGVVRAAKQRGIEKPHIVISAIEHSSIMETCKMLETHGCEITKIGVDDTGVIILDELKKSIKPNTVLISVMTVNNELGTIQPIREIAKIIRHTKSENESIRVRLADTISSVPKNEEENDVAKKTSQVVRYPLFHTDAAQAPLYNELYVEKLGVDMLTLDGSKIYGPRGIGALCIKRGTPIEPIIYGGGQESGMRSGTENLPSIAGFAKAMEIMINKNAKIKTCLPRRREIQNVVTMRQFMIEGLLKIRPDIKVNGPNDEMKNISAESNSDHRAGGSVKVLTVSPHILNVSIPRIDNEFLVMQLDAKGVSCSTKSSCLRDENESYVLRAIGANSKESVRFSFGRWTKKRDIKKVLKIMKRLLIG